MRTRFLPAPPSTASAAPASSQPSTAQAPPGPTYAIDAIRACRAGVAESHRSRIWARCHSVAEYHRAVRIAPSPCATGHRSPSFWSGAIKSRQRALPPLALHRELNALLPLPRNAARASATQITTIPSPDAAQALCPRNAVRCLLRQHAFDNLVGDRGEIAGAICLNTS